MDLKAVIEAGSEGASSLRESAAQVVEEVGDRAAQVLAAVRDGSEAAADTADGASTSLRRSAVKPVLLGTAALAAVGAGLVVWKRRRDAALADLSGEVPWVAPKVPTPAPEAEAATDAAPTKAAKSFGDELDEVAHHIGEDVVDAIETTGGDVDAAIESMEGESR